MLFQSLLSLIALATLAVGQIDPNTVPISTRGQFYPVISPINVYADILFCPLDNWCESQTASCPLICLSIKGASGSTRTNTCDPVRYSALGDGMVPANTMSFMGTEISLLHLHLQQRHRPQCLPVHADPPLLHLHRTQQPMRQQLQWGLNVPGKMPLRSPLWCPGSSALQHHLNHPGGHVKRRRVHGGLSGLRNRYQ